jgi:hypothetical protein
MNKHASFVFSSKKLERHNNFIGMETLLLYILGNLVKESVILICLSQLCIKLIKTSVVCL